MANGLTGQGFQYKLGDQLFDISAADHQKVLSGGNTSYLSIADPNDPTRSTNLPYAVLREQAQAAATQGGGGGFFDFLGQIGSGIGQLTQAASPLLNIGAGAADFFRQRSDANQLEKFIGSGEGTVLDPFGQNNRNIYANKLNALYNNPESLENLPGYKFARDQGEKSINRRAAKVGNAYAGGTGYELAQFNQGLASQTYNQEADRLSGLAGANMTPQAGIAFNALNKSQQLDGNAIGSLLAGLQKAGAGGAGGLESILNGIPGLGNTAKGLVKNLSKFLTNGADSFTISETAQALAGLVPGGLPTLTGSLARAAQAELGAGLKGAGAAEAAAGLGAFGTGSQVGFPNPLGSVASKASSLISGGAAANAFGFGSSAAGASAPVGFGLSQGLAPAAGATTGGLAPLATAGIAAAFAAPIVLGIAGNIKKKGAQRDSLVSTLTEISQAPVRSFTGTALGSNGIKGVEFKGIDGNNYIANVAAKNNPRIGDARGISTVFNPRTGQFGSYSGLKGFTSTELSNLEGRQYHGIATAAELQKLNNLRGFNQFNAMRMNTGDGEGSPITMEQWLGFSTGASQPGDFG